MQTQTNRTEQWRIQKFLKGEDNLSAPSSFIANAHNELYAFYTEKRLFELKYEPIGERRPPLLWISHWNCILTLSSENNN